MTYCRGSDCVTDLGSLASSEGAELAVIRPKIGVTDDGRSIYGLIVRGRNAPLRRTALDRAQHQRNPSTNDV
jgi:hypothetical protein